MIRLRPAPRLNPHGAPGAGAAPHDVFQRFFDLIERIERASRRTAPEAAPEIKARITRLDTPNPRGS